MVKLMCAYDKNASNESLEQGQERGVLWTMCNTAGLENTQCFKFKVYHLLSFLKNKMPSKNVIQ